MKNKKIETTVITTLFTLIFTILQMTGLTKNITVDQWDLIVNGVISAGVSLGYFFYKKAKKAKPKAKKPIRKDEGTA